MKSALILIVASIVTPQAAMAAKQDSQLWTTGSATLKLSDRWRVSQELVGRFSDNRNGLYEIESNTMLGYKLNKVVTIWGGYGPSLALSRNGRRVQLDYEIYCLDDRP